MALHECVYDAEVSALRSMKQAKARTTATTNKTLTDVSTQRKLEESLSPERFSTFAPLGNAIRNAIIKSWGW
eukprot:11554351-Karenia_brevis.AAC.1